MVKVTEIFSCYFSNLDEGFDTQQIFIKHEKQINKQVFINVLWSLGFLSYQEIETRFKLCQKTTILPAVYV